MTGLALANRYALLTGMRWLPIGIVFPVLILVKEARGLDIATIGQLTALYSITTILLELPTGSLADVIGRRSVVVLSSLTIAAGLLVLAIATQVWVMALSMVLNGVGRALSSGPLTAWYVDAVGRDDPAGDIQRGLSRGDAAETFGLGVGGILGGLLPGLSAFVFPALNSSGDDLIITLSVPLLLGAGLSVLHAVLTLVLVHEPPRPHKSLSEVTRDVPRTVRLGVRLGTRDWVLRRLMIQMLFFGVGISAVELLTPLTFADLSGGGDAGSALYGLFGGLAFLGSTVGALLAPRAARAAGSNVRVIVAASFVAAPLSALLALPVLGAAAAGYVMSYAVLGLVGPLTAEILHRRVSGDVRSTVLSVESLALQFGGVLASIGVGALAGAVGLGWGFAVVVVAFALSGLVVLGVPDPSPAGAPASADEDLGHRQGGVGRQVEV